MFKLTGKSGLRRAKHVPVSARKQGLAAGRGSGLVNVPHRPAFLPDTPQEQTMDNDSNPRLQGLEKRIPYK